HAQAPVVSIEGGEALSEDETLVLQQMFRKYDSIQIEHTFQQGFSGSTVLLIRPLHADGRPDAPVGGKIAGRQAILWEKKRYDSFVKDSLPPTTARIESDPSLPEKSHLGGLKYTFVRLPGGDLPVNLREYAANHDSEDVARFLSQSLFNGFKEQWWGQAQPYRFSLWQEYEFLLPPALILQAVAADAPPETTQGLHPLEEWSRIGGLRPGELVELENFTAQKIKRVAGILQVGAGGAPEAINRSSQVEVRGLDLLHKSFFRGELIRKLIGRVSATRD